MKLNLTDPASIAEIEFWREIAKPDYVNGRLFWAASSGRSTDERITKGWVTRCFGKEIGSRCKVSGYWAMSVSFDGKRKKYWRHRVLFAMAYGYWPSEIDHADRNRGNDALHNLRECTKGQNSSNKPKKIGCISSMKGVTRSQGKWMAQIQHNKRHIFLGRFASEAEAGAAYAAAAKTLHKEFACI